MTRSPDLVDLASGSLAGCCGGIGPYRVGFGYPQERKFIELDGVENHAGAAALQRDLERQNWLVGQGWVPLRFTWTDVMHHGQEVAAAVAGLTG